MGGRSKLGSPLSSVVHPPCGIHASQNTCHGVWGSKWDQGRAGHGPRPSLFHHLVPRSISLVTHPPNYGNRDALSFLCFGLVLGKL